MELHGVTGAPYKHPEVRKKMPAPFSRPSINVGGGTPVKREWQDISVTDVKKNDTVAEFGTVAEVVEFINAPAVEKIVGEDESVSWNVKSDGPVWRVRLFNIMGGWKDYQGEDRVFAFVAQRGNEHG